MAPRVIHRPRSEARRARRREEILDAAGRLFAAHGYAGTDTQLLVDHLRVGKGTLYRYFASKEALFLATVDRVMRRLRERIDARVVHIEDALERISQAVHEYLSFFADNPESVELLMQERAQFKDRKKPTYFEHREANVERWRALYRSLIAEGRVRKMPVERITDVMSDLCYGTIFTNYFAGRKRSVEDQARDLLDVVFNGILTGPERCRRGGDSGRSDPSP